VAAAGVDYLAIAAYASVLAGVAFAVRRVADVGFEMPASTRGPLLGHAVAAATLTLPAVLYTALSEASRRQATVGKRALGLRVVSDGGGRRLPIGRAVLRSLLKFAPWEVAHTALWHTPGWPLRPDPQLVTWIGSIGSLALAGWYLLSFFVGSRRTPYDRVTGARVVRADER
jgi:uncharacterized RDD family membrane protein YckC